jgi:hypothetical protein
MKRRAQPYSDYTTNWTGIDRKARDILSYTPPSCPSVGKKGQIIIWRDGHRFLVAGRGKLVKLD